MIELSLHILDIAQNSVNAGASKIFISVEEDLYADRMNICIEDNGQGMGKEEIGKAIDPFYTTGNKKTGLGIPLLKQQAELADGYFSIKSLPGKGTKIDAGFCHTHIDRQPLGDISGTIISLIRSFPDIDWIYSHQVNTKKFILDTREIRDELGGIQLNQTQVIQFLQEMINENLDALTEKNN